MSRKKKRISIKIKDDKPGMLLPVGKPNQVHKDKKKYTRKVKHKRKEGI